MTDKKHINSTLDSSGKDSVKINYFESGVALISLGAAEEKAVTLNQRRMTSLREALIKVKEAGAKGLVITGSAPEMFCVGADITAIKDVTDPMVGEQLAREGQEVFNLIESLPFTTVAAISGPCVGGGCEMVLACRYRLMSDDKSSIIGLPETKLGILPGFGGTQRLPRLVGIRKALDVILAGKTLRPRQALNSGLVNEVVQSSRLLERADSIASGASSTKEIRLGIVDKLLTFTKIGHSFVKKNAKAAIQRETKGFYPAPPAALDSVIKGLEQGVEYGLRYEAKELGRLIVTPESKALVQIFFLSEGAKAIGKGARKDVENINSVVIGAGVMGAGIAGVIAKSGCAVVLKDSNDAALTRGKEHINSMLQKLKFLSETEKSFILNRIETTTRDVVNASNINFVIEAVFEDITLKQKLLGELAATISGDAIIATNTSSLSVTTIASKIDQPERVVGMHFFNPVDKMPLVEIVMGEKTSNKTISIIGALASRLGKYPIVVKDVPGFLINRVLSPYLNEAAFMLQEGYSASDIDTAALRFGMPMGPIRLLDEVGLDVAAHVSDVMVAGYGERMKAPPFAKLLANQGRLGKKSGKGFYDHGDKDTAPSQEAREILKLPVSTKTVSDFAPLTERLVMSLVNECVKCLDEGVAGSPGPEAAQQINLGTVMGMGFPPFRGGILYYADVVGAKAIFDSLKKLERDFGPRFAIAPGITSRATNAGKFCS